MSVVMKPVAQKVIGIPTELRSHLTPNCKAVHVVLVWFPRWRAVNWKQNPRVQKRQTEFLVLVRAQFLWVLGGP